MGGILVPEAVGSFARRVVQAGRWCYPPGLWEGPPDRPWLTLTFDDGPHPEVTLEALSVLKQAAVPATFFLIGGRAERFPELVRRIGEEGHEVGNHTWTHRPLTHGPWPAPRLQLERTEELLSRLCPGSLRVFRAPFGVIGPGGAAALREVGLLPVYWSVVPGDWDPMPPDRVRDRVLARLHPGAVIVLHAGQTWHAGVPRLASLIEQIRERGYEFVSLARMLDAAGLSAERR
jgi:peptidoglycan-N-acetylglucosamine deacetylase